MAVPPRSVLRIVKYAAMTVAVLFLLRLALTEYLPTRESIINIGADSQRARQLSGKPAVDSLGAAQAQNQQPPFSDLKPAQTTEDKDSDVDKARENTQNGSRDNKEPGSDAVLPGNEARKAKISWDQLGTMATVDDKGWAPVSCNTSQTLRRVLLPTKIGNLTIYVYGQASDDVSVTARALRGEIFEREEIVRFLELSSDLPLIDVGANVGLVTLQAAIQGRQVLALEPVYNNAVRLCRAAQDFGFRHLVHVVQNAISDTEGPVTLAMDLRRESARFTMTKKGKFNRTSAYAIRLDHILDVLHFSSAALKIDVEGFEGHVLAGAERLFQEVDIPLVWLEWEHVKKLPEFGGQLVLDFMRKHGMTPYNLMTNTKLEEENWKLWPFTVLWKSQKSGTKY